MPFATFNLEQYPLVQITFDGAPNSQDEMNQYLAQFEGLLLAAATTATTTDSEDSGSGTGAARTGADSEGSVEAGASEGSVEAGASEGSVEAGTSEGSVEAGTSEGSVEASEGEDASGSGGVGASEGSVGSEGIKFIIDLGILGMSSSVTMLTYAPQQVEFIQRIHADPTMIQSIAATAIVVRSDVARRVVEWVLQLVTLQKPFAAVGSVEEAQKWCGW